MKRTQAFNTEPPTANHRANRDRRGVITAPDRDQTILLVTITLEVRSTA